MVYYADCPLKRFWFWWAFQVSGPQTSLHRVENGSLVTSPPRLLKTPVYFFTWKIPQGDPNTPAAVCLPQFNSRKAFQAAGEWDRHVDVMKQWRLCFWEWVEERWGDVFSTAAAKDRMVITAAGTIAAGYTSCRPWGEDPLFWVIY